jgi:hypothetical protein
LYSLPNIIRVIKSRRMRWPGHVACMGEMRNIYKMFVEKPANKRSLLRRRYRWKNNIKMHLKEVGFEILNGFVWLRLRSIVDLL